MILPLLPVPLVTVCNAAVAIFLFTLFESKRGGDLLAKFARLPRTTCAAKFVKHPEAETYEGLGLVSKIYTIPGVEHAEETPKVEEEANALTYKGNVPMIDFLSRPHWTATTYDALTDIPVWAANTHKVPYALNINKLFTTEVRNKLQGYKHMRATVCVAVTTVAPMFTSGAYVIYYQPGMRPNTNSSGTMWNHSGIPWDVPHVVVDINEGESKCVVLKIPFQHEADAYQIAGLTGTDEPIPHAVKMLRLTPYEDASSAAKVIHVFHLWLEDVELYTPCQDAVYNPNTRVVNEITDRLSGMELQSGAEVNTIHVSEDAASSAFTTAPREGENVAPTGRKQPFMKRANKKGKGKSMPKLSAFSMLGDSIREIGEREYLIDVVDYDGSKNWYKLMTPISALSGNTQFYPTKLQALMLNHSMWRCKGIKIRVQLITNQTTDGTFQLMYDPTGGTDTEDQRLITKLCNIRQDRDPVGQSNCFEFYIPWSETKPWLNCYTYDAQGALSIAGCNMGRFLIRPITSVIAPDGLNNVHMLVWNSFDGLQLTDPSCCVSFGMPPKTIRTAGVGKVFRLNRVWPAVTLHVERGHSMAGLRAATLAYNVSVTNVQAINAASRVVEVHFGAKQIFSMHRGETEYYTTELEDQGMTDDPWSITLALTSKIPTGGVYTGYVDVIVYGSAWPVSQVTWHANDGGYIDMTTAATATKCNEVLSVASLEVGAVTGESNTQTSDFGGEKNGSWCVMTQFMGIHSLADASFQAGEVDLFVGESSYEALHYNDTIFSAGSQVSSSKFYAWHAMMMQDDLRVAKPTSMRVKTVNQGTASITRSPKGYVMPPVEMKYYPPGQDAQDYKFELQGFSDIIGTVVGALPHLFGSPTKKADEDESPHDDVIHHLIDLAQHMIPHSISSPIIPGLNSAGASSRDAASTSDASIYTRVIFDDTPVSYFDKDTLLFKDYSFTLFRLVKSMYAYRSGSVVVRVVLGGNTNGGYQKSAWITRARRVQTPRSAQKYIVNGQELDNDLRAMTRIDGIQNPQKEMLLPYNCLTRKISIMNTQPVGQMLYLVKAPSCTAFIAAGKDYKLEGEIGCPPLVFSSSAITSSDASRLTQSYARDRDTSVDSLLRQLSHIKISDPETFGAIETHLMSQKQRKCNQYFSRDI